MQWDLARPPRACMRLGESDWSARFSRQSCFHGNTVKTLSHPVATANPQGEMMKERARRGRSQSRGYPSAALLLIVMVLGAAPIMAESGFGKYLPKAQYDGRVTTSFYLSMRDGVRLAVRVSRPAVNGRPVPGRLPVIWQAGLTVTEAQEATRPTPDAGYAAVPSLTRFGYVVVQVARRGNGQSFGSRRGYNDRTEADDAYEITEWLARQPWSNGRVGVYGCSNTGDAAMQVLTVRPPHLKAVFAGCFAWNKFDAFHRGGIYAQWGTGPTRTVAQDLAIEPVDGDADKLQLRQAAQEHQKSTNLFELWKSMPYRDTWSPLVQSRFWYEGSISSFAERIRQTGVPVYIQGGWHDELRDQGFIALLNIPGSRIMIGPWKHCRSPGFELLAEIHRFFDTYLQGIHTGLGTEPRIHYYTIHAAAGRRWHSASVWPIPGIRRTRLYLSSGAELSQRPPNATEQRQFTVKPQVACANADWGPFAQPCHVPGNGVSFTWDPMPEDLTVTGSPIIRLTITADRPDANLFAYLEDVAPDGTISEVTEGRLKASLRALNAPPWKVPGTPWHRSWREDDEPLAPGRPAGLEFDLMPTSYVFEKGHRLQLTVTGSDYRERVRDTGSNHARITVISSAAEPSYLDIPVAPSDARH